MTPRRRHATAVLAAGTAVTLLAGACAPTKSEALGGAQARTLKIATTADVVNYNPMIGNSRTDNWITDLMYPRLLRIGADGEKRASLATRWGYVDRTTGYWQIRDDMRWSDGRPLTAKDVAFTVNAIKRDKPAGVIYGQLVNVERARAVSRTRVELDLSRPDQTVVSVAGFWMNVVPAHVFGRAKSVAKFANAGPTWVSAGPFRLTKVVKGQSYTLERVDHYPLAPGGIPYLRRVVFRVIPDVNSEILALRNGDVDLVATGLPPTQVEGLRRSPDIDVRRVPGLGYAHLQYNMKRKPLDDIRVRRALTHVVDYDAIRDVVLQGQAASTGSCPIPPVLSEYVARGCREYEYSPKKAAQLLRSAGYHRGELRFTLTYALQDTVTAQWATIVQSGAKRAGIDIELRGLDRNAYMGKTETGDYDIYAGNFAIMDDPPTNMTLTYLPDGAINYSKVDDPALSKLIVRSQAARNDAERIRLMKQASLRVRSGVYDNVMYTQDLYLAHRSKWRGFVVQPSELLSVVNPDSLAAVRPTVRE